MRLLHTGQHYDRALSDGFIERLGMPQPDANLGVGSGTHAEQTAAVMAGVEADLGEHPAELVLVAGRRQLDDGGGAGGDEAQHRRRPPGVGAALARLGDARGGEPGRHRPGQRPAAVHLRRRGREPGGRGDHRRRRAGREHDDRQPLPDPGGNRPRGGARRPGRGAARLRAGDPAPPRAGGRPGEAGRGDRGAGRARRRDAGPVPGPPAHGRRAWRRPGSRWPRACAWPSRWTTPTSSRSRPGRGW